MINMIDAQEIVDRLRKKYATEIKPLMQNGHYTAAGMELDTGITGILFLGEQFVIDVHSGLTLLASGKGLAKELREGKKPDEYTIEFFEAYLAQTKLPVSGSLD